jgi:hypothetical protein
VKVYQWPQCTWPDCGHVRSWATEILAQHAYLRHADWTKGSKAICYCHGLEAGATFPCDETQKATHSE